MTRHAFPEINEWFNDLPDPRKQEMCVYSGSSIYNTGVQMFLSHSGSRNAFDVDRNAGALPENMLILSDQEWEERRLGERRTVSCSGNLIHHLSRVSHDPVAKLPLKMVRRLMKMRFFDDALLFGWYLILIDGTLQDRGRCVGDKQARYRYVVEAKPIGPEGTTYPLMTEFVDMRDPVRDKEDCELNGFMRLAKRLHNEFPRLSICLLMDGLYPVKRVLDICHDYAWKFIATLKEGRQPTAWDEAVQIMLLSELDCVRTHHKSEDGDVEQICKWVEHIPVSGHDLNIVFASEVSPKAATLWCWVTNFYVDRKRVHAIVNSGGKRRGEIETVFNVQKNGGFGLEHTFCVNETAAKNLHIIMHIAWIIWQLFANGVLRRITKAVRKVTDVALAEMLRTCLSFVRISKDTPAIGQIRLMSSA